MGLGERPSFDYNVRQPLLRAIDTDVNRCQNDTANHRQEVNSVTPRNPRVLWRIAGEHAGVLSEVGLSPRPSLPFDLQALRTKLRDAGMENLTTQSSEASTLARETLPGAFSPMSDLTNFTHMLYSSYLNVLLLAIPLGIVAGIQGWSPMITFGSNFLALIPLALILGQLTEDLILRFGEAVGGLLNATFGNVVEMILGLAALSQGLVDVVAASLIGSILSNLLLVMGCCFLFGGFRHKHQAFNAVGTKAANSLLLLACISIITPTMASVVYGNEVMTDNALQMLSHVIALLLVMMYGCYLFFQLRTHAAAFNSDGCEISSHPSRPQLPTDEEEQAQVQEELAEPVLSLTGAIVGLAAITVLVAISSEYLTGALEAVSEMTHINKSFLGLIVLPIAGNAAEHFTAVFFAVKDRMDAAIAISIGSSIQIAVFVLPVTVLVGWVIGCEMTLNFDPFAVIMMTVSVILSYFVTSDGYSNWLLGLQLILTYVLISCVFLFEKETSG